MASAHRMQGSWVPRSASAEQVKREAGEFSSPWKTFRHSPRCCRPDDSGETPLCFVHGKAPEKDEGKSEDRPRCLVWCPPGWGETGRLAVLFSARASVYSLSASRRYLAVVSRGVAMRFVEDRFPHVFTQRSGGLCHAKTFSLQTQSRFPFPLLCFSCAIGAG